MSDDWFGHRDINGKTVGDKSERVDWDFALMTAFQVIEDGTDEDGNLIWEVDYEGVLVESQKTTNRFHASVDRKTQKKDYKPTPGERWRPVVKPVRGQEYLPTRAEWLKQKAEEQ